jgi:t-SNARE complex subunit (syntaxin)
VKVGEMVCIRKQFLGTGREMARTIKSSNTTAPNYSLFFGSDGIGNTYAQVASKYQDILALEHSMAEIQQMFFDLALLTKQQEEL